MHCRGMDGRTTSDRRLARRKLSRRTGKMTQGSCRAGMAGLPCLTRWFGGVGVRLDRGCCSLPKARCRHSVDTTQNTGFRKASCRRLRRDLVCRRLGGLGLVQARKGHVGNVTRRSAAPVTTLLYRFSRGVRDGSRPDDGGESEGEVGPLVGAGDLNRGGCRLVLRDASESEFGGDGETVGRETGA